MHSSGKILLTVLGAVCLFAAAPHPAGLAMTAKATVNKANSADTSGPRLKKVTGIIKKMDGKTLQLERKKRYSLSGVKVVDLTGAAATAYRGKLAEMTFINNRLTEVVIR